MLDKLLDELNTRSNLLLLGLAQLVSISGRVFVGYGEREVQDAFAHEREHLFVDEVEEAVGDDVLEELEQLFEILVREIARVFEEILQTFVFDN